jgi:excisionase family DNA binding protein
VLRGDLPFTASVRAIVGQLAGLDIAGIVHLADYYRDGHLLRAVTMSHEIIPLPPIEAIRGYTVAHSALYLGTSVPTVYKILGEGRLASRKLGKRRVIPGAELIRFLKGEEPVLQGDPIDGRASELGRIGGKAGGLAKARKQLAGK